MNENLCHVVPAEMFTLLKNRVKVCSYNESLQANKKFVEVQLGSLWGKSACFNWLPQKKKMTSWAFSYALAPETH